MVTALSVNCIFRLVGSSTTSAIASAIISRKKFLPGRPQVTQIGQQKNEIVAVEQQCPNSGRKVKNRPPVPAHGLLFVSNIAAGRHFFPIFYRYMKQQ